MEHNIFITTYICTCLLRNTGSSNIVYLYYKFITTSSRIFLKIYEQINELKYSIDVDRTFGQSTTMKYIYFFRIIIISS